MPAEQPEDSKVPAIALGVAVLLLILSGAFVTEVIRQKRFDDTHAAFTGFISYGSPIQTIATDSLGVPTTVVLTESRIDQPVFTTRKVGWQAVENVDLVVHGRTSHQKAFHHFG